MRPDYICTVTRRTVEFPYMPPDNNGPRWESGINTCLALAVFNTSGIFLQNTA
jgi:hypothetical protein